jgi:hypothetical protein
MRTTQETMAAVDTEVIVVAEAEIVAPVDVMIVVVVEVVRCIISTRAKHQGLSRCLATP